MEEEKLNLKIFIGIILLLIALVMNSISSNWIYNSYTYFSSPHDIFLDSIERDYLFFMKIAEIVIISNILLFIFFIKRDKRETIRFLLIFSLFEIIRAILLPLTVYGLENSSGFLSNFITFQYGLFPSGHIAIPFLFFLMSYKKSKISWFFLYSSFLVFIFLILSKQHYTIDIISSLFIVYSIKSFVDKNLFK